MTITLDIKPEIKEELARQAAANGRALETHAATLLEKALELPASTPPNRGPQSSLVDKSLVEICAMVSGLTEDVDFSRNPSTGRAVNLS